MTILGSRAEEAIDYSEREAIELVISGDFEMSKAQSNPPMGLLEVAIQRCEVTSNLGPAATSKDVFRKIGEHVFRDGLRQDFVEAQTLHWKTDLKGATELVETCLSNCTNSDANIIDQLKKVLGFHFAQCERVVLSRSLTRAEMEQDFLVPLPHEFVVLWFAGQYVYYRFSPAWFRFYFKYEDLHSLIQAKVLEACQFGHLLISEETQHGDRLLSPERFTDLD
ncbi:MAG: hypothetical protein ACU0C9_06740, partial [Paracoccaceae bacterium]